MSADFTGREQEPRVGIRRMVLVLTPECGGDRVKISDGNWHHWVARDEAVVVDEDRAARLLAQRIKGKPFLRVQERLE